MQDNWGKIYVFVSVSIAKVTLSKLLLPPVRKTRKDFSAFFIKISVPKAEKPVPPWYKNLISSYHKQAKGRRTFEKLQEPAQHPLRVRDKPLRDGFAIAAGRRDRRCLSRPPAAVERLGVYRA